MVMVVSGGSREAKANPAAVTLSRTVVEPGDGVDFDL